MSLFAELQRRKVFKVGAAYLVVAWLVIQAASIGFPAFDAPPWVLRVLILIVLLGFPIAVVLAWIFEATPEGVKLDATKGGSKRVIAVCVALCVLAFGWYFYGQPSFRKGDVTTPTAAPEKSIAVLPFVNMSGDAKQDFFSDGMSEELLNALAQVKDLKVAGRTSSFYYKGKNEDLRTIGKALGVANILEGSVRQQGDKVRITAQLIRVADDTHLWSHAYDGNLSDVFELQENIARAITDQLKVALVGEQKTHLVPMATTNPEAYSLYLQATAIFNRRDGVHIPDAIEELKEAVRLDPKYARAHARLASLYAIANIYTALDPAQLLAAGEHEAQLASELEPTLAEPYAALGTIYQYRRQWVASRVAAERAVALDPGDPTANFWLGLVQVDNGYRIEGIASIERALVTDPLLPNALAWRGFWYLDAGDRENARSMAQRSADEGLHFGDTVLALLAHTEGRDADAVAHLTRGMPGNFFAILPDGAVAILAQGVYGDATQRATAVALIDTYLASRQKTVSGAAPWALLVLGEPARSLQLAQDPRTVNDTLFLSWLWSTQGAVVRKLPQFPEFTRKMGMTQVWEKYGPPDGCQRKAPNDYACE